MHLADMEEGDCEIDLPPLDWTMEPYQLTLFAKAAGLGPLTRPTVQALPTLLYVLVMNPVDPFDLLRCLDVDLERVLHARQRIEVGPCTDSPKWIHVDRTLIEVQKRPRHVRFTVRSHVLDAPSGRSFGVSLQTLVARCGEQRS